MISRQYRKGGVCVSLQRRPTAGSLRGRGLRAGAFVGSTSDLPAIRMAGRSRFETGTPILGVRGPLSHKYSRGRFEFVGNGPKGGSMKHFQMRLEGIGSVTMAN
jgi:hypothetical protein